MQTQAFFDELSAISLRYGASIRGETFNIFRILRKGHEEVSLHSRFLYELLNPKATHGMGDVFLVLFTKICGLPTFAPDKVQVLREHASIDLLVQDNDQAIVIENKIYAIDQQEQLLRYFNYAKGAYRQPTLVYLTLHGTPPSPQSLGSYLGSIEPVLISYKQQISDWITACIREADFKPALRETLLQYKTLVDQLTGNDSTMEEQEGKEVLDLVSQGDNIKQAALVFRNWNAIRYHAEQNFWTDLITLAKTKYVVIDNVLGNDAVSDIVWDKGKPWYGFAIEIGNISEQTVKFEIERGDDIVCYGIGYASDDETIRNGTRNAIQLLGARPNHNGVWMDVKSGINFQDFQNNESAQALVNSAERQRIVDDLWHEMQAFIKGASTSLQAQFGENFVPTNGV